MRKQLAKIQNKDIIVFYRKEKRGKREKMVKIIADSTCDLSKEILAKYDVSIVPLHILSQDEAYLHGVTISP